MPSIGEYSAETVIEPGVAVGVPPSIYEMTLAAGFTEQEACEFAKGMGDQTCETPAADAAVAASAAAQGEDEAAGTLARPAFGGAMQAVPALASGDYIGDLCHKFVTYEGDGSKHAYGCIRRYHDAWWTNYRFIANKMQVTGWSEDPGWYNDRLTGVGVRAEYKHPDSHAVEWDPFTDETVGSCHSKSTSVTGKKGVTYSQSATVCPDILRPWHSPAFQYFGAKWLGPEAPEDARRDAAATSVQKIPRTSPYYSYAIRLWLRWS